MLSRWRKGVVEWTDGETAYISVPFSWHVPRAYARAVWLVQEGYRVRVGGPGVFPFSPQVFNGLAQVGGALPDVVARHNSQATFASRGCPVGCTFCIVPKMEGRRFTLLPDFTPRPTLCDNNLSALPADYQAHIIERYQAAAVPLLDANSGFEPATFDEEVYRRWKPVLEGPWRFAYDETGERDDVERVMRMLAEEPGNRKRVYVLIGNEPVEACMDRIGEVIAWGGEPHVQPEMKLKALRRRPWVKKGLDWNRQLLTDVARWANSRLWRSIPFQDYRRGTRKDKTRSRG